MDLTNYRQGSDRQRQSLELLFKNEFELTNNLKSQQLQIYCKNYLNPSNKQISKELKYSDPLWSYTANKQDQLLFMQQSTVQSQTIRKNLYDFISRMNVQPNARSSATNASAPISSNILQLCAAQPQTDPTILSEQNQNLRLLVANLTKTMSEPPQIIEKPPEPLKPVDMEQVVERNNARIRELEELIGRQKSVIEEYQKGFSELETSITNLQTLDADIYKRLSTHDSSLHNRVYELRRALHSGAPYERLMRMIEDIHI